MFPEERKLPTTWTDAYIVVHNLVMILCIVRARKGVSATPAIYSENTVELSPCRVIFSNVVGA